MIDSFVYIGLIILFFIMSRYVSKNTERINNLEDQLRKTATNGNHSQEKPKSNLKGGEWGVEQSSIPDTHSKEKNLKGGLKNE